MTFDGGRNGIAFRVFIEKVLVPQLWSGACVVMENLPAHQVKGVKEMMESAGASLIYLSPYSPDFHLIEPDWSKLKQDLRSVAARSRKALEKTISLGLDVITENEIRNWFAHCCYCTSLKSQSTVKSDKFRLPSKRQIQQLQAGIEVIVIDVAETEIETPKKTNTLL